MSTRSLQAVLRSLADAEPPASDGELLRRFLRDDKGAFTELVRRHGRLVWTVCRHLSGTDAEADDAFQATFLVLLRNAKKIRDAGRLSAWLHGVAHRVCTRARREAQRRTARERASAVSEGNDGAIADSAWDRALAAVHEELAGLPETLRVPFVLCCIEGKGVTEAAEQLGWKLGTFSGRLTRAKNALLARLDVRGLTVGAVAGLGLATPPPTVVAGALALARPGVIVPGSILQLTQGVIGMSTTSFKLFAAMVLVCGLGLGLGTSRMPTADAQPPAKASAPKADSEADVKKLQAELEKARLEAARAEELLHERARLADQLDKAILEKAIAAGQKALGDANTAKTTRWEYDFVEVSEMNQAKFVKFLQDRENRGWEFNGMTTLTLPVKPTAIWVFRRPVGGASVTLQLLDDSHRHLMRAGSGAAGPVLPAKQDEAKAIEDEIIRLQDRLATLTKKSSWERVVYAGYELPLDQFELAEFLGKLAAKKFKTGEFRITPSGNGLAVEGEKEVVEWATAVVKKLTEK